MGWWDYKHIGASADKENVLLVKHIFEYMGYTDVLDFSDGEECGFSEPDVYYCMSSVNPYIEKQIHRVKELEGFDDKDLLNLLNALFPSTYMYTHQASGNNTTDSWENHDEVYNTDDMTCYGLDKYTDYGGGTYQPNKSWKARFILEPPKMAFVQALIDISTQKRDTELTALLLELTRKLKNGEIVYPDDDSDDRKINKKYDIVRGIHASLELPTGYEYYEIIFGRYYSGATEKQIREQYESTWAQYTSYKNRMAQELASNSYAGYLNNLNNRKLMGTEDFIAPDTDIVIDGKRFAVDLGFPFSPEMMEEIRIRGGLFNPSGVVRKTDFYIVDLGLRSEYSKERLEYAQKVQKLGFGLQIITEYQLWKALLDERNPILTEEELEERKKRVEEEKKAEEAERQRKKKEEEEAKERRKIERQQREEEKQRLTIERQKEKEERQALKMQQQQEQAERKEAAVLERQKQLEQNKLIREQQAKEKEEQKRLERQEALANAHILYAPGEEPEAIRRRMNTLFAKLDATYPDKRISGLYKDHKKWGETVTELYRQLGYPDNTSFLEAYGYTVVDNKGGRAVTVDPDAIIEELKRRYPNGAGRVSVTALAADNPDLPWKTLSNNAIKSFGMSLSEKLKAEGIIGGEQINKPRIITKFEPTKTETVIPEAATEGIISITTEEPKTVLTENTHAELLDEEAGQSLSPMRETPEVVKEEDRENSDSQPDGSDDTEEAQDMGLSDDNKTIHISYITGEEPACEAPAAAEQNDTNMKNESARIEEEKQKLLTLLAEKEEEIRRMKAEQERLQCEADERSKREAEERSRKEAEKQAKIESEERVRREAEERARIEAEEQAKREAEERERQIAEEIARAEAEEKTRREKEEQVRREAEAIAKQQAEALARQEAEERARMEAEAQAKREAEEKTKTDEDARNNAETQNRQVSSTSEKVVTDAGSELGKYAALKERLLKEIAGLKDEAESLRGMFAFVKRNKIYNQIEQLEDDISAIERIMEITEKIPQLKQEAENQHGLFASSRREKIHEEIDDLEQEMEKLIKEIRQYL